MQKLDPKTNPAPSSPSTVVRLRFHEHIEFDPNPVRRLYADLGHEDAEEQICDALENIARLLDRLQRAIGKDQFELTSALAMDLGSLADGIGLRSVAKVSSALRTAAICGEARSLTSIFARLKRVAEPSMVEVWSGHGGAT